MRKEFLEDIHEQVRYCDVCHKPILLVDWCKGNKARKRHQWLDKRICIGSGECKVARTNQGKSNKRWRENYFRAEAVKQFHVLREALGLDEADTESTFSPWDIANSPRWGMNLDRSCQRIDQRHNATEAQLAFVSFGDWFWNVHEGYFRFMNRDGKGMTVHGINTTWYFLLVFKVVFPDEWKNVPYWAIEKTTRKPLYEWRGIDEWKYVEDGKWNHRYFSALFDKMLEEWYPEGVSFDDYIELSNIARLIHKVRRGGAQWFLVEELISKARRTNNWNSSLFSHSMWAFVSMFQKHVMRGDDGRFGKFVFTQMDFKVHANVSRRTSRKGDMITQKDHLTWFWDYLIPYFGVEIEDKENFPYNTPVSELQQLINIDYKSLKVLPGYHKFSALISGWNRSEQPISMAKAGTKTLSIQRLIALLYPDYEFDMALWTTRSTKGEKKMNQILLKVAQYFGFDWSFSDAEYIPTNNGGSAKYWDTRYPMKIDGISKQLRVITEGQGAFHYEDDPEDCWLNDGINYTRTIPDSYRGKDRTLLGYRQDRDRLCRNAIVKNGFTPVYVILTDIAYPVKGVHGDIPKWNLTYVTAPRARNRIGLAETFDMQGREDIGDMIRKYYYEVVLA